MKPKSQSKAQLEMLRRLKKQFDKTRQVKKTCDNLDFMWGVIVELDQHGKLPIVPYPEGDVTIKDLKG